MGAGQRTKEQLTFLLLSLIYTFGLIVNNENILTDGTDRKEISTTKIR